MTLAEIQDLWDAALGHAEREVDQAYAHSPHLAREFLERYFFLMRVCAVQSPSAAVHSIGMAGALSRTGFKPWEWTELEKLCQRMYIHGQAHADPPRGDGNIYRWISTACSYSDRKGVIERVRDLFGTNARGKNSGLEALLSRDKEEYMATKGNSEATNWIDEAQEGKGFFKPGAGRNKLVLTDEPVYRDNQFGRRNLDIPTDHGIFSTTQRTITSALVDYAKRHKGKTKGATLIFTCNGLAGTAIRYEKVEIR